VKAQKLTLIAILLLYFATIGAVYAKYITSFDYSIFNNEGPIYRQLDQNYTEFTCIIENFLTFNTTTGKGAKIGMCDREFAFTPGSEQGYGWEINLYSGQNKFAVWVLNNGVFTKVKEDIVHDMSEPIYVTYKDGILYVGNRTDYDAYVQGYSIPDFTAAYVAAHGEVTGSVCLSGYVNVTVDDARYISSFDVSEWIPTVVAIAMLGVALSFVKKFTK